MGSGQHCGTMNMRVGRSLVGINFASLLPDHPNYAYWMSHFKELTGFILGTMETVGGAWYEPPIYQMFGPSRWLTTAQAILRNGGFIDYGPQEYWTRMLQYNANQTMPDVRWGNRRILPGMADSGDTLDCMFGLGQGIVEGASKDKAGFFNYMHELNSVNGLMSRSANPDYSFMHMSDIETRPGSLNTTYIPGYGVAFRAHFGDPDETGMLFRCGYNRSHWGVDDQNVILYSKGAPLASTHAYQYYRGAVYPNYVWERQCRIVNFKMDPPNGRVHTDIQDYGFGVNADYAAGRMYFSGEELGDGKGEMEWRRHILFLKSSQPAGANYFVMRDLFTGYDGAPAATGRTAWWTWLNLDKADRVKVAGVAFDAAKVANEKITDEGTWPALTGNTVEMGTQYGASSWFWFDTPKEPTVKAMMKMNYPVSPGDYFRTYRSVLNNVPAVDSPESSTIFRIEGNSDQGFFYVLYPRKGSEATPICSRLAPGALKIVTVESTDYVFVGLEPFNFNQDGVKFTGKAGAVRLFRDHVVFCMNSGTGEIGYNGTIVRGSGPFERSVRSADLIAGTTDVGGTPKVLKTVNLGSGMTVRGELPFTAKVEGNQIKIHTDGRARPFLIENPPSWLVHPQFFLDGQEWLCLKSDEASQGWGTYGRSKGICFSTIDGSHDLVLRERIWPSPWDCGMPRTLGAQK